jgi:hypothetical protein
MSAARNFSDGNREAVFPMLVTGIGRGEHFSEELVDQDVLLFVLIVTQPSVLGNRPITSERLGHRIGVTNPHDRELCRGLVGNQTNPITDGQL